MNERPKGNTPFIKPLRLKDLRKRIVEGKEGPRVIDTEYDSQREKAADHEMRPNFIEKREGGTVWLRNGVFLERAEVQDRLRRPGDPEDTLREYREWKDLESSPKTCLGAHRDFVKG